MMGRCSLVVGVGVELAQMGMRLERSSMRRIEKR